MSAQPIHTYNFSTNGIHGSVYYRSKRAADLVNTPRFHRYCVHKDELVVGVGRPW